MPFMDNATFFNIPIYIRAIFLHLPYWMVFLGIVAFFVGITLLLYWLLPYFTKPADKGDQVRVSAILVGVIGAFYGMLFGLVNVNLWQNYQKLQEHISQEASALSAVVMNSSAFGEPAYSSIKNAVKEYIQVVRTEEWQTMRYKKASPQAWQAMNHLYLVIQNYHPSTPYE